jgi:hypothetical protein
MTEETRQLFQPAASNNALPHIVRLPNLLEGKTRPRSESSFVKEGRSYGFPGLSRQDSNLSQNTVKRAKTTTGHRPNTALAPATNLKRSPEHGEVLTSAEMKIYRLSKYNNLIKPEMKITNTAVGCKEFLRPGNKNKGLLEEHVARENESFDKHEVKRTEILRWLQNSAK